MKKQKKNKKTTQPFRYDVPDPKDRQFGSFVAPSSYSESKNLYSTQPSQQETSQISSAYLCLKSRNASDNPHNDSISSFPVTNYEDSEFMIQAYQRK